MTISLTIGVPVTAAILSSSDEIFAGPSIVQRSDSETETPTTTGSSQPVAPDQGRKSPAAPPSRPQAITNRPQTMNETTMVGTTAASSALPVGGMGGGAPVTTTPTTPSTLPQPPVSTEPEPTPLPQTPSPTPTQPAPSPAPSLPTADEIIDKVMQDLPDVGEITTPCL
jgi:hypothetical protein